MPGLLNIEYHSGDPIEHQGRRLTPFSRLVSIRLPGGHFHFVWNKPSSLLVSASDGTEQILPIYDQTQRLLIAMIAGGLFFGLVFSLLFRLMRRSKA